MNGRKAREIRSLGKDRKTMRAMGVEALTEHIHKLEEGVEVNGRAAIRATEAYRLMGWAYFWSQVAIAALLQHLENNICIDETNCGARLHYSGVDYRDIEKAILFVPAPGDEGPQI